MTRKTIEVAAIKTKVNEMLADGYWNAEQRKGMMLVLEEILHATGNYRGFNYLGQEDLPHGALPGIHWEWVSHENRRVDGIDKAFENTDDSRVRYY